MPKWKSISNSEFAIIVIMCFVCHTALIFSKFTNVYSHNWPGNIAIYTVVIYSANEFHNFMIGNMPMEKLTLNKY